MAKPAFLRPNRGSTGSATRQSDTHSKIRAAIASTAPAKVKTLPAASGDGPPRPGPAGRVATFIARGARKAGSDASMGTTKQAKPAPQSPSAKG